MDDQSIKLWLPIYAIAFFSICFLWRTYVVWKSTGVMPIKFGKSDSAHDFIGTVFKTMVLAAMIDVVLFCFADGHYDSVGVLMLPEWARPIALLALTLSLVGAALAQAQMGKSWRIGVDPNARTELVFSGLYRYTRNPIYLFLFLGVLGLFLLLPSVLSLILVVLAYVLIQIQIRLEEEYLERTHGQSFLEYKKKVRRWI